MKHLPWVFVAAGLGLALQGLRPPAPRPANAPADNFSALRAMADVDFLAAAPRPVGSPHHEAARDFLEQRLRGLGAECEVQDSVVSGVPVANLIARFPGDGSARGAILLCAHYDSVAAGTGAGDDAMGCAVVLEIARALALADPPPARDLILLLTDGEERGLLGARAFLLGGDGGLPPHSLAAEIALVLNFEGRGSGGPAWMFQTGRDNGALIAALARAPHPAGSSLAKAVYERMPNDTDLTVFLSKDLPGLNFACIDRFASYHTALDTPERLDPGTVQQMGDQGLAVARWARSASGDLRAPDAVYFNLYGRAFVRHPLAWTPAITALLAMLSAFALGRMRARMSATVLGVGLVLLAVLLPALLAFAATRAFPSLFSLSASHGSDLRLRLTGLTVAALAALAAWALTGWAARRWKRLDADAGALALTLLAAMGAAILLPEGAFLLLVPGFALAAALIVRGVGAPALLARGLAALTICSLAGVWIYNLLLALALPGAFVVAAFAALSAVQLRPLWRSAPSR